MHRFQVSPTPLCVICEAGSRCTMTDATCCVSNITGEKCPLPRTHLIGILLLSLITFALKDTAQTHAWAHTQARRMPRSQESKYPCQADYTAVVTHRWRKRSALASTSPHARTATRKYMYTETVAQPPVHHVAIRAPACTQLRLLQVHSVRARGGVWRGNYI